jgi:hypothetical protein
LSSISTRHTYVPSGNIISLSSISIRHTYVPYFGITGILLVCASNLWCIISELTHQTIERTKTAWFSVSVCICQTKSLLQNTHTTYLFPYIKHVIHLQRCTLRFLLRCR